MPSRCVFVDDDVGVRRRPMWSDISGAADIIFSSIVALKVIGVEVEGKAVGLLWW